MDALSHALITAVVMLPGGIPGQVLPFAICGAVLVDADILFPFVSNRFPSLYLFTHGGVLHSPAGAAALSVLAPGGIWLGRIGGVIPVQAATVSLPVACLAILAGALLHIALDALALPGIPLLYPFSEQKFTAGLLPGPSLLLLVTSAASLGAWLGGIVSMPVVLAVAAFSLSLLVTVRAILFISVRRRVPPGRVIPLPHPLHWLLIREGDRAVTVSRYTIPAGLAGTETFERYTGTDPQETAPLLSSPLVRRLLFHSYTVVVSKTPEGVVFSDPIREGGYLRYPFSFRRVLIPWPEKR